MNQTFSFWKRKSLNKKKRRGSLIKRNKEEVINIMPILWGQYTYPKHQPLPKGFIEDSNWAHEHIGEFVEKYLNQWVAV